MPQYQRASINSANDVRAVVSGIGSHYFDTDTMRFFSSRLLSNVVALDGYSTEEGRRYLFVTSEREAYSQEPRAYTVRMLTLGTVRDDRPSVEIDTVGGFQAFSSAAKARRFARSLLDLPECGLVKYGTACRVPAWREIWYGAETPATACDFHMDTFTAEVIATHSDAQAITRKFGPAIAAMPLHSETINALLER